MVFEHLRPRPLTRITSTWGNQLVDALELLYGNIQDLWKRGSAENPFKEFYAYYGFFLEDLFVKNRRVIKDGDPINIYRVLEPAKEDIAEAVSKGVTHIYTVLYDKYTVETSIESKVGEIRDVVVRLNIDHYGRVGVVIAEPIDVYGRVRTVVEDSFEPVSNRVYVTGSQNVYGVELDLYKGGRPNVNIYYRVGGPAEVYIEGSIDGSVWRVIRKIDVTGSSEETIVLQGIAFPYIRVRVPTTGIEVELEIVASR